MRKRPRWPEVGQVNGPAGTAGGGGPRGAAGRGRGGGEPGGQTSLLGGAVFLPGGIWSSQEQQGRWWRQPRVWFAAAVLATIAVAVVTDLPTSQSPATQLAGGISSVKQMATDLNECEFGLSETQQLARQFVSGSLTASQRHTAEGLISQDYTTCSLTSNNLYDLVSIETPGSRAGKDLGAIRDDCYAWASTGAFYVIGDLSTIVSSGITPARRTTLAKDAARADRLQAAAESARRTAEQILGGSLPSLGLVHADTAV